MDNANNTNNKSSKASVGMDNAATTNKIPTPIFTPKNIPIGIVIVFVVVVGAFYIFRGEKAFDVFFLGQDEAELASITSDIEAVSQDNIILDELDQTFSDILDEIAGISADEALDEASIAQEASQADLSQTLDAFAADDAALQELDQSFDEVLQ